MSILLLVLAGVIWGSSFVVVKDSLDYITPVWQLALRLMVACVVMWIVFCWRAREITLNMLREGIWLGILLFLALFFQTIGAAGTTAGKCSFLTSGEVAVIPFFSWMLLKKRPKRQQFVSAAICIMGVGLITLDGSLQIQSGDALVLVCAIFYGIHMVYIDEGDESTSPLLLHLIQVTTATVMALVAAFIMEPVPGVLPVNCNVAIIYCGIFEIFLGFLFQLIGQKNTNPFLCSILLSMESFYAIIFASIFLGEGISLRMIVGGCLIVGAVVFSQLKFDKKTMT